MDGDIVKTVSAYREGLSGDVGKRYDEKIATIGVDPYILSTDDFKNGDRDQWPDVVNYDIIQFFVLKESAYTREQLRNHKSLEAYKFFQDGWVQEILHKDVNGAHLIKAKVNHSMRIREKPLEPWVIITDDGIESAHCTCMAGLGECCSHIGSVLFAMEQSTKARDETTVTDVPAYWLFPSKAKFDAPFKRLRDMDFQSAAKRRRQDNQPTNAAMEDQEMCVEGNIPSPTKHEEREFFIGLNKALNRSAVLSLTPTFAENFKPKCALQDMPKPIKEYFIFEDRDFKYDEMVEKCNTVEVKITPEQVKYVEDVTKKQSECTAWYKQRCGRITSSVFYSVCHTNIDKPSVSLLKKITSDINAKITCVATEWGKKNEKEARKVYCKIEGQKHSSFNVCDSGLYLCTKQYQFAASPDGMVECTCCGKGCREIKCPYSMKEKLHLDVGYICDVDNKKTLDIKHAYYYQIQMQLFVTERDYCDFIVWWPNGIFIERVMKNTKFLEENIKKALLFHKMCVLPELVFKHFSRKSLLSKSSQSSNANCDISISGNSTSAVPQYCTCNGTDDGTKMIMCENENCDKQWYHMRCIKMKRAPKGKWICAACK